MLDTPKKLLSFIGLIIQFSFLHSSPLLAAEAPSDETTETSSVSKGTERKLKLSSDIFCQRLSNNSEDFNTCGAQGGILFSVSDRLGLGALVAQGFLSNLSPAVTELSLEVRWALSGTLMLKDEVVKLGGKAVIKARNQNSRGWMGHAFLTEYIVNTSTTKQLLTGVGGALSYEMPAAEGIQYRFGIRSDYAINNTYSFLTLQAFAGLNFWF